MDPKLSYSSQIQSVQPIRKCVSRSQESSLLMHLLYRVFLFAKSGYLCSVEVTCLVQKNSSCRLVCKQVTVSIWQGSPPRGAAWTQNHRCQAADPLPPAPCSAHCCSLPGAASSSPLWSRLLGRHRGQAPCSHPTLLLGHRVTPCVSVLRHGRRINFTWTSLREIQNFASKDLLKELLIICKADAFALGPNLEQRLLSRIFQMICKHEHSPLRQDTATSA